MKNEKNYTGFLIRKIQQILQRFHGTKTLSKTSYFLGVTSVVANSAKIDGGKKYVPEFYKWSLSQVIERSLVIKRIFWQENIKHQLPNCDNFDNLEILTRKVALWK